MDERKVEKKGAVTLIEKSNLTFFDLKQRMTQLYQNSFIGKEASFIFFKKYIRYIYLCIFIFLS